jgi:hypothetical protein
MKLVNVELATGGIWERHFHAMPEVPRFRYGLPARGVTVESGGVDSAGVRIHLSSPLSGPQVRRRYNTAEANDSVCTDAGWGIRPALDFSMAAKPERIWP